MTEWQPYREPLHRTLLRTGIIALIVGAGLARWRGGLSYWPIGTLIAFWPSFGGHWVEVLFLNFLRPRISSARALQVGARLGVWFIGGVVLAVAMRLTSKAIDGFSPAHSPPWWIGGIAFICIELVVHLVMQLRGLSSFYNGRG